MPVILPGGTTRLLTPTWAILQADLPRDLAAQHDRLFHETSAAFTVPDISTGDPVLGPCNCPVFGRDDACALDLRSMISAPLSQ